MLLTYNPPLHDVDVRGHTALDLAKLWGHKKCARVIKDAMWKEQKAKEAEELKKLTKYAIVCYLIYSNSCNFLQ